jgi:hypothetical protein
MSVCTTYVGVSQKKNKKKVEREGNKGEKL